MAITPADLVTMHSYLTTTNPGSAPYHYSFHFSRITTIVNNRRSGWKPTINEYIEGMIRAMLTNFRSWILVAPHWKTITAIFKSFSPSFIKMTPPAVFVSSISAVIGGSVVLAKQMDVLSHNVKVLEDIFKTYSPSGEPFEVYFKSISSTYPMLNESDLDEFTQPKGTYKLDQMGVPLVSEFLKNMGFELPKPDRHLKRFLSSSRMGNSKNPFKATDEKVFTQIQDLAKSSTFTIPQIDLIIWSFCANGFGEICAADRKNLNAIYVLSAQTVLILHSLRRLQLLQHLRQRLLLRQRRLRLLQQLQNKLIS